MKNILYFNTLEDIKLTDMMRVSKKKEHDYSKDYLTFEALEDGTFSIEFIGGYSSGRTNYITRDMRTSFSYSIDNGETWQTFTTPNDTYTGTALTTPTIPAGGKVIWKGIGVKNFNNTAYCRFCSTGRYNVSGNLLSLYYGDDFLLETDLPENGNAARYFYGNELVNNTNDSKLISAENLILSCVNVGGLFYNCVSLTTAPKLPATSLTGSCYSYMFYNCKSLTTAPALPATTLTEFCYSCMFDGCTSLTTAPELPAISLVSSCYNCMFNGCTNLNYIKAMFTTTPKANYTNMWVSGVAETGTFVKNVNATWTTTGANGIPTGWTVETADN